MGRSDLQRKASWKATLRSKSIFEAERHICLHCADQVGEELNNVNNESGSDL